MSATDTHMSDKMQKHLHLSLTCLNTTDKRAWMHPIKKNTRNNYSNSNQKNKKQKKHTEKESTLSKK